MSEETLQVIKNAFKKYYFRDSNSVEIPERMSEREFGYLPFGGSMIRHISLKNPGDLTALLVKESPRGVYVSCSYYNDPALPMTEKGWKTGDLAFDIDCDDLNLRCKLEHDRWICKECNKIGKGLRPEKCPGCTNTKILTLNWSCKMCLNGSRQEAIKLMEILERDFGIRTDQMSVYFSGNKGYHLTVEGSIYEELDQRGRREMADYLSGNGMDIEVIGLSKTRDIGTMISLLPSTTEPGWRGRIASFFTDYEDDVNDNRENYNQQNRRETSYPIEHDVQKKIANLFSTSKPNKFRKLIDQGIRSYGSKIDPSVTMDIHRIFRLPGSLHEKTGLSKKRCMNIDSFDPENDPVELSNEPIHVRIEFSPSLSLRGETFGPYNSEEMELPMYAAVYLMGNKLARIVV